MALLAQIPWLAALATIPTIVDNINDKIIEYANQGIDTVQASVSYGLAAYLENLILTGSAAINATGNTQNNVLTGNSGNNILDGGLGADTMIGGLGHDLYIVDNSGDVVTEATNAGIDSVESSVNYALGSNVENIILTGTATTATGNSLDNFLAGNAANNTISGGAGADILIGGAGNDSLTGGAGDDIVIGDGVPFVGFIGSQINCGLGNTTGANGTADTVIFSGARAQYNVTLTEYNLPVIGVVKVFKITDSVTGRDGSDFVVGVENFKFADATYTQTTIFTPAVNVAPVISSNGAGASAAISIAENTTTVTTVTATDADSTTLSYSIAGGVDATKFSINAATGALSFVAAPNFEAATDVGANNIYDVIVQVSDGANIDTQAIAVTVTNVNDVAPVINVSAAINVAENTSAVTTVTATDADSTTLIYSIAGGLDATKFSINAATGALSFVAAPNFEAPTDAGANNIYDVTVKVSDGLNESTQAIAVTVKDVNDNAPVITSNGGGVSAAITVAENTSAVTTVTATDADVNSTLTYSLTGADASLFSINAAGAISFVTAPNFEAPTDAGADNVYNLIVKVSDGTFSGTQALVITVTDVNDVAPTITSAASATVAENTTAVTTVTATDADSTVLSYTLAGADASLFSISNAGAISFVTAPNFEAPTDAGANNIYDVIVKVSDGVNFSTQAINISVTDVNDVAPTMTSAVSATVSENSTAVTTVTATDADSTNLTYSLNGGADAALFNIDALTGALSFIAAPNFEAPADAGADNGYNVIIKASDGTLFSTQAITVTVQNVNEAPAITSNGGAAAASISFNENATSAVTTVAAADVDANTSLTYSLDVGLDAASFNINAASGELTFITPPNFEAPTDSAPLNSYKVVVRASDGALFSTQTLTINVQNVNEAPVISSNGGAATASISFAENSLAAVTTVAATDVDANSVLSYSLAGGADAALFSVDAITGLLSFIASPNFEAPTDVGGNNIYDVNVQVSDGTLFDTQSLAITVTNVNEAPAITSNSGAATAVIDIAENTTAVTTVTSTDIDANTTLIYSLAGGADAAKFNINSTTGALSFITPPNFESPTDVAPLNSYNVNVQVSDGALTDTQALTVNVTNVNDIAPVITSNGGGDTAAISIIDSRTGVTIVTASDQDLGATQSFSITGGVDQNLFTIDNVTGLLSFKTMPNHLAPIDVGANNIYDVNVQVSDGVFVDTQALAVQVNQDYNQSAVGVYISKVVDNGTNATVIGASSNTYPLGTIISYQWEQQIGINQTALIAGGNTTTLANQSNTVVKLTETHFSVSQSGFESSMFAYIGGATNDSLHASAQLGENLFFSGLGGNDTIIGHGGTDIIIGGLGVDTMTGGGWADTYIFNSHNGIIDSGVGAGLRDIIKDFNLPGSAISLDTPPGYDDLIDLRGIDANTAIAGDQAFTFNDVASTVFTAAGQLIYHYEGTGANEITVLQGNVNAGLTADFEIELTGHIVFNAANDFNL